MEKEDNHLKSIDIEKVIASKNPRLLKFLPRFILRYLKKILHEDEMNETHVRHMNKSGIDFIDTMIKEFQIKINVIGGQNIPQKGGIIMASNHPLGGLEGMALMSVVGKYRKEVKLIANDLLLNIVNIREMFVPVNKHGANSRKVVRIMDETYSSNNVIITFPFGLVSRKRRGKIYDLEWKKSFVSKAKEHKRNILPVHVDGRNSNFFYNLSNIRKFLGIKYNIEMLYLINEMYKQKNNNINITIGQPISYNILTNKYSDKDWAEKLRQHVYKLAKDKSISFNQN